MRHVPTEFDSGESALTMLTLPEEEKEEGVDERIQRREGPWIYDFIAHQFLSRKAAFHLPLYAFFLSFRFYFKAPFFLYIFLSNFINLDLFLCINMWENYFCSIYIYLDVTLRCYKITSWILSWRIRCFHKDKPPSGR